MISFEPGKTYTTRSICNHDCILRMEVVSRTNKTIRTLVDGHPKTMRVSVYDGVERVALGRYSMAPGFAANR